MTRLLFERRGLLRQEVRIVARPRGERAAVEFEDARREARQQRAIMRDEEHPAAELQQRIFEPLDHLDVEVVGRLVEQQQLRIADQRAGQRDAPAPAARQLGDARVGVEPVDLENPVDALVHPPAVAGLDLVLQALHAAEQRRIATDLVRDVVIRREQRPDLAEAACHHVEHGGGLGGEQFLLELRDPQRRLSPDLATVGRDAALGELQQRGLAGAVAADQADALAGVDLEARVVEQGFGAERDRDGVEAE